MKLNIALSGGGVKGAFHIGVLQALIENNIEINSISGVSSGSIVASLFSVGYTPLEILHIFNYYSKYIFKLDKRSILELLCNNKKLYTINKYNNLERILNSLFYKKRINDISSVIINLVISSVDLDSSNTVYFTNSNDVYKYINENKKSADVYMSGNLSDIVVASSAYPVLFRPKYLNNKILVDGGVNENIIVDVIKNSFGDKVIAVNLSKKYIKDYSSFEVSKRCLDIMKKEKNEFQINQADSVIEAKNIQNIGLLDFDKINYIANEGYIQTNKFLINKY